jgi:hypothetical protein
MASRQHEPGTPVAGICPKLDFGDRTYFRWQ